MGYRCRLLAAPRRRHNSWSARSLAFALLFTVRAFAAPIADGPYVMQQPDGTWLAHWVEGDDAAPRVKDQRIGSGRHLVVPAVGSLPEFTVRLRRPDPIAPDDVPLPPNTSLFVVADTHGQFEILAELLQKHGIVDRSLRWSFGKGHLAILGDVFDRGPNQTEILWLLYKLEDEAKRAGGGLHLVLGNHEARVLLGDRRDLHPKYPKVAAALGASVYAALWDNHTFLGQWLRTRASVMKLGPYLLLHGGISREVIDRKLTLAQMNGAARNALANTKPHLGSKLGVSTDSIRLLDSSPRATDTDRALASFVIFGKLGPLWYRGYFLEAAEEDGFPIATPQDVDMTLERYGVRAILVGHTVVDSITPLYDGKVIAVQVYMRRDTDGRAIAEGLRIDRGRTLRARIDGTLEPLEVRP